MAEEITGDWKSRRVCIDGKPLTADASLRVFNHSPDGFAWGYGGSGPAQLALALLMRFGLDKQTAVYYHQKFKDELISPLPMQENFTMPAESVRLWIAKNVFRGRQ